MDKVFITQLKTDTTIGVYDWEKKIKQSLYFDIEMLTDTSVAAKNDDIKAAVNYAEVSEKVTKYVESRAFELIETVCEQLAQLILTSFNVQQVTIKVDKPGAVENAQSVGVEITRSTM
ncbi:dihydroneopterin aldolase [Flocculibacter collagenilyticus]|uniref:dihydroneopterin aldolase n=1 Tax=Flocculibacter collagenilyticus TaxID=2744479 RepID=UPI0018F4A592|nr:dihydroneopterin aldolase [Flocculibacter collagenilyticus]